MIPVIVSVDTEEDNWLSAWEGVSAENVRELPRLAQFFERLGVRPTYFVTYQVSCRPWAAAVLRDTTSDGQSEIAAHVHPWNTPPYANTSATRPTMLRDYPLEEQAEKVRVLTATIAEAIGIRPTSFRAGRFGLGPTTIAALLLNGYTADSSVTPFHSWAAVDRGPDFSGAPFGIYRLDGRGDVNVPVADGPMTEVPVSAGFTRFTPQHWPAIERVSRLSAIRALHLAAVVARTGLFRRTILSPEVASVADMLALSRRLIAGRATHLHLFFHSSSLRPGLSPFVRSRADLARLLDKIERYLEGLAKLESLVFRTVGEVAAASIPTPAGHSATLRTQARGSAATARAVAERPQRLLAVSCQPPSSDSPGGERWAGFSKYLVRRGWEVHLLTPELGTANRLWEGVAVHSSPPAALRAAINARELARRFRPDVVITSGPPHAAHLAGLFATLGTGVPLVLDLQAPWSHPGPESNAALRSPFAGLFARLVEDRLFRYARSVTVNSGDLLEALTDLHAGTKVSLLRGGVDIERLPRAQGTTTSTLSVACSAVASDRNQLDPILRAFRLFLDRTPAARTRMQLRITGATAPSAAADLAARIGAYGLGPQVQMLGALPPQENLHLIAECGLSIVLPQGRQLRIVEGLYESLGLGVPTLVCGDPESATAREARRLGAAVNEPENIEGLARALDETWRGARPRALVKADAISYEHLAGILEALLLHGAPPGSGSGDESDSTELPSAFELQGRPKANWMWLADPPGWDRALELTFGRPLLTGALGLRFGEVSVFDFLTASQQSPVRAAPTEAEGQVELPFADKSFDFVAIHNSWAEIVQVAAAVHPEPDLAVLKACLRVLRPGGCLYAAGYNPSYLRLPAAGFIVGPSPQSLSVVAMRRRLARAGFVRQQTYFATPSHVLPETIVPAERRAALAHERLRGGRSLSSLARRAIAAGGLCRVLHPSLVFLAYR